MRERREEKRRDRIGLECNAIGGKAMKVRKLKTEGKKLTKKVRMEGQKDGWKDGRKKGIERQP